MPRPILEKIVRYSLVLLTAAGCTVPTTADQPKAALLSQTGTSPVLQADAMLHQRLQAVLDADSAYNQVLAAPATTMALDEINGRVIQAEMALQQTIDSLEQQAAGNEPLLRQTAYFENMLQSRRALSDLRMVLSADSDDSAAVQRTLMGLRSELQEKNKKIAALEQAANKTRMLSQNAAPEQNAGTTELTYAQAKGETLAALKQRNKNLALALNNVQVKYFVLGRDYLVLKKQHERTVDELAAVRKANGQK